MSVRVRFAPSPTGWLHVGGARTAYFNWLFARQHQGAYVLRIEDTDVQRSTQSSEAGVLRDLAWLGLGHDEGPDVGGPHGPYRQSERLPLYRESAERLVAQGLAYPCFCTDAELEVARAQALAHGRPPHYNGRCRSLSSAEREALRREGRPESVRFAVEPRDWVLHDLVRGEVRFPEGMVGDFVLLRSSGLPTYNFAATVDDAAMRITHVIRAEEHLANTPRQLMLYGALRETPPAFAHVSLILNPDRSKMSKRQGEVAVAVSDWRRAGYVPDALLCYLAFLGFHPGDDREILTRDELLEAFSMERVGKSGSVFDAQKLSWVNGHFLHHATGEQILAWVEQARDEEAPPWIVAFDRLAGGVKPETLKSVVELVRGNIRTLGDLPEELGVLLEAPRLEEEARRILDDSKARQVCLAVADELRGLAVWTGAEIKSAILRAGSRLGVQGKALFQPVRVALTGRTHGPELALLAEFLDKERCVSYLDGAAVERTS